MNVRPIARLASVLVLTFACVFSAQAQDADLPLEWNGKGKAWILTSDAIEDIDFDMSLYIDTDGWTTGEAVSPESDDDGANLERFYYSPQQDGMRRVILVMVLEDADDPMLFIMDGKTLQDRMFFGVVYTKAYEEDGKVESNLSLGNRSATGISTSYIPTTLKNAMDECQAIGNFTVIQASDE